MNLETRKIEFVQEFLNLQNQDIVSRLVKILKKEKSNSEKIFETMTITEFNKRKDKSESDFQKNKFKRSSELLAKYE